MKFYTRQAHGSTKICAETRDGPCVATFSNDALGTAALQCFMHGASAKHHSVFNLNTGQYDIGSVAELMAEPQEG